MSYFYKKNYKVYEGKTNIDLDLIKEDLNSNW